MKELDESRAMYELEGSSYFERRAHWVRMQRDADMEPNKDWKKMAKSFRPRMVHLCEGHKDKTNLLIASEAWDRMSLLTIPPRGKGYWNGYRFLTVISRALDEAKVPDDLKSTVACDHADYEFARWFRRFHPGFYDYISWHEFAWCLFIYIMAFET